MFHFSGVFQVYNWLFLCLIPWITTSLPRENLFFGTYNFSPLIFYQMVHHIQLVGSQDLRPRRKMQKTHDLYQWLIGSLRSELAKSDIFCVNPINRGYTRLTCTCALINGFQDVLHTDDTEFINVDALLTGMVHIWNYLALGQYSTCCIRVIAISLLSTPSNYYFLLLL